jgi:hypothetical protein
MINIIKNIRIEIKALLENIQLADKTYFKTGKLSQKVRDIIVNKITNGDNYTKIICDIYYAMLQSDIRRGKRVLSVISDEDTVEDLDDETIHHETKNDVMDINDLKKVKSYYIQLKEYNKNLFPIKNLDINNVKDIWGLIRCLNLREEILNEIKKFPSIAVRNLKNEIRIPRDSKEFLDLRDNIKYINSHLSYLSNRDEKSRDKIYQKIFKSNNTFSDIIHFVEQKENLLGGETITKNKFKEIIKENSYDLETVYSKGNIMVVSVTDVDGIKKIGCNSLWCFTYGKELENAYRDWDKYSTNGYVYVIINFSMPSNDPEFMMVLTKPLPEKEEDIKKEEENPYTLFYMDNEPVYSAKRVLNDLLGQENVDKLFLFGEKYFDRQEIKTDAKKLFKEKHSSADQPVPSFKDFYKEFLENFEEKYEDNDKIKNIVKYVYNELTINPDQMKLFELKLRQKVREFLLEQWSKKYKKSIDCSHPKGFSQKAHCAAKKKRKRGMKTKSKSPFNEGLLQEKKKKINSKKEQINNDFDRVEYYLEHYKNLSPSDFTVKREGKEIKISGIEKK